MSLLSILLDTYLGQLVSYAGSCRVRRSSPGREGGSGIIPGGWIPVCKGSEACVSEANEFCVSEPCVEWMVEVLGSKVLAQTWRVLWPHHQVGVEALKDLEPGGAPSNLGFGKMTWQLWGGLNIEGSRLR